MKEKNESKKKDCPASLRIPLDNQLSESLEKYCKDVQMAKTSLSRMLLTDFLREKGYWD